jgi:hypothetical protein
MFTLITPNYAQTDVSTSVVCSPQRQRHCTTVSDRAHRVENGEYHIDAGGSGYRSRLATLFRCRNRGSGIYEHHDTEIDRRNQIDHCRKAANTAVFDDYLTDIAVRRQNCPCQARALDLGAFAECTTLGVRGFGRLKAGEYRRGDGPLIDDLVTESGLGQCHHIARGGADRPCRSPDRDVVEERFPGRDQDGERFDISRTAIGYLYKRHLLVSQHRLGGGVAAFGPPTADRDHGRRGVASALLHRDAYHFAV